MRKRILTATWKAAACAAVLMFAAVSCSKDDEGGIKKMAFKSNLTLAKYYNAAGGLSMMTWSDEDEAAMVVGNMDNAAAVASPIKSGSDLALFVFNADAFVGTRPTLVCYYPSDADITCRGGVMKTKLPATQNGAIVPMMVAHTKHLIGGNDFVTLTLEQFFCTMYVNVPQGNYTVSKIVVRGNNGELLAGDISVDVDTWAVNGSESSVTLELADPVDCTDGAKRFPVLLAPVTLTNGYTVTITTTVGDFSYGLNEPVALASGKMITTDDAEATSVAELVIAGDNMVYILDAARAGVSASYHDAVTWSWNAAAGAETLSLAISRMDHISECKLVDGNKKILVVSSYGWCVMLDVETKNILFYATSVSNAHSAELLPGGRIAVACAGGTIELYDSSRNNAKLDSHNLASAHGVVWNEQTQRVYAGGGQQLQVFKLKDWETDAPKLELEKTVATPKSSLHDLTLVNSNTLCVAGNGAYLYDIGNNNFREMTLFSRSTAIKALNYNDNTGEIWYADATTPEGNETWSTQTIRYAVGADSSSSVKTIKVPDLDMYKVRVKNW